MDGEFLKYTYPPTGDVILFCRTASGDIYSRVDNAFARANGYADRADMENQVRVAGMELPEWMLWHSELLNGLNLN